MIRRAQNLAFDESLRLLLSLHELLAQGKGDDAEADNVRDQMDAPWYEMTPFERNLVNDLSADLYTVADEHSTMAVPSRSIDLKDDEFKTAVATDNWSRVLSLVREEQDSLHPATSAFIRGVAWMHLGQPEVGLRFFRAVERLRPLSDDERLWFLTCLMQTARIEETLETATEFAVSPNPLVRLRASNALSLTAARLPEGPDADARQQAIAIAEEAIPKAELLINDNDIAALLWQTALSQLALDYDEIGATAKAVRSCKRILEKEPNNLDAQLLLDWLTYDENPAQARESFRRHFRDRLPQQTTRELPGLELNLLSST